ncbi:MAG: NeuD/PglB/VioB family sugar acetyltransferase [Cyclobacteriaceae bacterium]|nr:NeuD/PglB/VioB family sugar acetyltransferase [Cyclobacteriaceae bacterium]
MDKPVIIFGYGPLTRAAIEILVSNNIDIYGILDDKEENKDKEINNIPVLSNTNDQGFLKFIGKKCEAFIASDDNPFRKTLVKMLIEKRHVMPINAIHSKAYISDSAFFGHGNMINMGVTLGAGVEIKNHTILNSSCTLDHGVIVHDFVQIGSGTVVGAETIIEENVFIGTGCVLVPGIKIGKNARIGAGSVVISNVENNATVFGNPAVPVKK